MCDKHQSLLVQQAKYKQTDSWQMLVVVCNIALFQGTTADPKVHEKIGDDISKITSLGCLACYKPDLFGEVVEVAKLHDFKKIKELGEKWIGVKP
jgi:hypothetical protein